MYIGALTVSVVRDEESFLPNYVRFRNSQRPTGRPAAPPTRSLIAHLTGSRARHTITITLNEIEVPLNSMYTSGKKIYRKLKFHYEQMIQRADGTAVAGAADSLNLR